MAQLCTHTAVEINGEVYSMKPTFAAICEIERNIGKGFFKLAHMLQSGDFLLQDLAEIIACGIKHGGNSRVISLECIGESLSCGGLEQAASAVAEFMSIAITGSRNEKP